MSNEKKVVIGGFRATLALIVSIVALIVALVAFNRTGGQTDLNAEIKDLRARMEKMKEETTEKVGKVRQETAKALEDITKAFRKEKPEPEEPSDLKE